MNTLLTHNVLGPYQSFNLTENSLRSLPSAPPLKFEVDSRPIGAGCLGCGVFLLVISIAVFYYTDPKSAGMAMRIITVSVGAICVLIGCCMCFKGKTTTIFDRDVNEFFYKKMAFNKVTGKVQKRLTDIVGV